MRARGEEAAGLLLPVLAAPKPGQTPRCSGQRWFTAAQPTLFRTCPSLKLVQQADEVASRLGDDRLFILSLAALCASHFAGEPERARRPGRKLSSAPASPATTSCSA